MSSPRLLSNRYELGDTLGYGGMSEVHRGRDIRLGRDVAVKVLRADLARDPTFQLRFRREAQNAAALNHPAIVAVYDTGETESENGPLPYIVMEYVEGRTLRDIVKSEGPLTARRAMEVMADASAALDFSHRHGIVHRDVKPANIMITLSGAVKVMDFGIARALADGQAAVTQTAAVIGTAQYLSPEQARGESVDARSDVYASGCVLFELMTGEPPFTGDSPVAVAYQHVREDPRKPSDVNEQCPPSLDAVVLKALSKNPANRYQSAAEMRSDLVRVLSGQRPKAPMIMSEEERTSVSAPTAATDLLMQGRHRSPDRAEPYEEPYQDTGRKRSRSWLIALVTVLCLAVFVAVAWGATAWINNQNAQPRAVPVPDFKNRTVADASFLGSQQGFKLTWKDCSSTNEQVDKVVTQKPDVPTRVVKEQDSIELCRGTGPKQVQVPQLSGLSATEAVSKLDDAGLKLGDQETKEVSDDSQADKVIDWTNKGATVPAGSSVSITIGKKVAEVPVPYVTNQSADQARLTLESLGFSVSLQQQDSDQPSNTVLSQSPSAGSKSKPGSQVTLTVSNGQQISMPSLSGMSPDDAQSELRKQGWSGTLNQQKQPTDDSSKDDKIVNSTPGAGQKISKNQSVTVIVGEYSSGGSTSSPPTSGGLFPPFD